MRWDDDDDGMMLVGGNGYHEEFFTIGGSKDGTHFAVSHYSSCCP